ncbi:mechanosensitive ion channel family protein [Dankookia sp. GCM10030260]|uniref:mechanosensitive ion channel family protein n=1 Tax=Dankookia sp. GCM10030260 TaxID=3273390 RepID=UPI00362006C5
MVGYLADILSRLPEISVGSVPGSAGGPSTDLPARWTIPGTEIRMVRLADGPRAGDYVFSAETVARLPLFHAQAEGMPRLRQSPLGEWTTAQQRFVGPWLARLRLETLPAAAWVPLLGTSAWKLLAMVILGLMILASVLRWSQFVRRRAATTSSWRRHAVLLTVPGLLAALVMLGHGFIVWQLVPAQLVASAETIVATIVLYLAAAWAAMRACWLAAEAIIASPMFPDGTYDAHPVRIVARVGSLLSAGAILIYCANDIGVPALGLLAAVSVGGIALALAAQSTVENLLGGISILADRPFRVGDQVRYGANSGTVETVGPRSTRIRGADGTLTTVPNADLAKTQVVNVSAWPSSLFQHRISLPDHSPPAQVGTLLRELHRRIAAHLLVEVGPGLPRVRVVGLSASSLAVDVEVHARIMTTATAAFLEVQEALILEILRCAEASGIDLTGTAAADRMQA